MGLTGRSKRKKRKAARRKAAAEKAAEQKALRVEQKWNRKAKNVANRLNKSFDNPRVDPNAYNDLSGDTFGGAPGGKAAPDGQIATSQANAIDSRTGQAVGTPQPEPEPVATPAYRGFGGFNFGNLDFSNLGRLTFNEGTSDVKKPKRMYNLYNNGTDNVGSRMKAGGK